MKTSNKLLLTLALVILATFGIVHLTLYARLKNGHTIVSPHPKTGWIKAYEGPAPAVLTLTGNINVTIVPSDSFYVEVQEEGAGNVLCRTAGKDSVMVSSDSMTFLDPYDQFQAYSGSPWVSVHSGNHTAIRLSKLLALVKGSDHPGGPILDISASFAQVWLGETYGREGTHYPTEYYDSIRVRADNSNIVLHSNAAIGKLSVQLDDYSELNDKHPNVGALHLQYSSRSKLNLSGAMLDRIINTGH